MNAVTFVGTGAENVHLNYSFRSNGSDLRQQIINVDKDLIGKVCCFCSHHLSWSLTALVLLQSGIELWTIPNPDAYSLTVRPDLGNFTLDYLLITPDKDQGFAGQMLVIDDKDGVIKYDGNWSPSDNVKLPSAVPMKGTLTKATKQGAKFDLQFTGSCASSSFSAWLTV